MKKNNNSLLNFCEAVSFVLLYNLHRESPRPLQQRAQKNCANKLIINECRRGAGFQSDSEKELTQSNQVGVEIIAKKKILL